VFTESFRSLIHLVDNNCALASCLALWLLALRLACWSLPPRVAWRSPRVIGCADAGTCLAPYAPFSAAILWSP